MSWSRLPRLLRRHGWSGRRRTGSPRNRRTASLRACGRRRAQSARHGRAAVDAQRRGRGAALCGCTAVDRSGRVGSRRPGRAGRGGADRCADPRNPQGRVGGEDLRQHRRLRRLTRAAVLMLAALGAAAVIAAVLAVGAADRANRQRAEASRRAAAGPCVGSDRRAAGPAGGPPAPPCSGEPPVGSGSSGDAALDVGGSPIGPSSRAGCIPPELGGPGDGRRRAVQP
jgi:hypothetical protein